MSKGGPISRRVERIRRGEDPQCIGRTRSGWVILAKFQPAGIEGGCMLLPDPVVPHLEDLDREARAAFMDDFAELGAVVREATGAERINYLVLCNAVPELHGHCVPRFASEDSGRRNADPFEGYDFGSARVADATGDDAELFARLREVATARGLLV